jgi:phage terminase large subunit-like protein
LRKEMAKGAEHPQYVPRQAPQCRNIAAACAAMGGLALSIWPRGAEKGLTLKEVLDRSEVVTVGLDGGGLDDLWAVGVIGREKGTQRWLCVGSRIHLSQRVGSAARQTSPSMRIS